MNIRGVSSPVRQWDWQDETSAGASSDGPAPTVDGVTPDDDSLGRDVARELEDSVAIRMREMDPLGQRHDRRRGNGETPRPLDRAAAVASEAVSVAEWAASRGDEPYEGAMLGGDEHSPDLVNAADEYVTTRARDAVVEELTEAAGERIFGPGGGGLLGVLIQYVSIPTDSPYVPRPTPGEIFDMEAVAAWERTYGPSGENGGPTLERMREAFLSGESGPRDESGEGDRRPVIMGAPSGHRTGRWGSGAWQNRGDENQDLSPGRGATRRRDDTDGGESDPFAPPNAERDRGSRRANDATGGDPDPDPPDGAPPAVRDEREEDDSSPASGEATPDDDGATFRRYRSLDEYENGEEGEDLQLPPSPETRRRRPGDGDDVGKRPPRSEPDERPHKQFIEQPLPEAVSRKAGEADQDRPDVGKPESGQRRDRDLENDVRGRLGGGAGGEVGPAAPRFRVLEPGDPVEGF